MDPTSSLGGEHALLTRPLFMLDPIRTYPVLARADGVRVWDTNGKEYLDAIAGIAVANVGYGRQEVVSAMAQQAACLPYAAPNIFANEPAVRLAGEIATLTPGDLNWIHFTSGGSEAVEVAIKLARQYHYDRGKPEKSLVMSRWTSYHGATLGALSATGMRSRRLKYEPMLLDFPHIPPIYCYRCPWELEYPACQVTCAAELERRLVAVGPERVAAFIAEPVVASAGGAIAPQPEYFPAIREICDRYDILLIADEVLTGFGRTGAIFAMDHWDVIPDILVIGKGVGGGYAPLAAVAVREFIHDSFEERRIPFDHIFSYAAHPVSTAAGLAVLEIWRREHLLDNVIAHAKELRSALEQLRQYQFVGDVRSMGFMAGIEFVQDQASRRPFQASRRVAARIQAAGLSHGIVTYPGTGMADGTNGDVISLYPPLTFSEQNIAEMAEKLHATLAEVEPQLRNERQS